MKDSISRQEKIFIYLCDIPSTKTLDKFFDGIGRLLKNTSNAHDIFYGIFDKIIENIILLRAKLLLKHLVLLFFRALTSSLPPSDLPCSVFAWTMRRREALN